MARDWNEHYATGQLPWDTGIPAPELVELFEQGRLPRGRALDVGCGTGTNARYLAGHGYAVVGIDLAGLAIDRARSQAAPPAGSVSFEVCDFLSGKPPAGPFDLVFDRGCLHVFDAPADRARFAERVAGCLRPDGLWVSLLGSTEGPPRDQGPPRRSARDIALAVEPALEILELRGNELDPNLPQRVRGWVLLARRRTVPAQPSTASEGS